VQGCGGKWEWDWGAATGLTDAGGAHAGGDLLAQRLAEGDVALLEDALEDLASQSVTRSGMRVRGRDETYDGLELGGPLLRHVCGGRLMEMGVSFVSARYWLKSWLCWKGARQVPLSRC
jgi:hypothetical protein